MLQVEIALRARQSILLAGSFVIAAVLPVSAQTARTSKQSTPPSVPSQPSDAIRIKQDEARLLALLAKDPEDAGALAGMGWVRSRQKNYTAAISYLERAKLKRPDDRNLNTALEEARFHVLLTEAQNSANSNEPETAQKFYAQALEIHPNSREALSGLHGLTIAQTQGGGARFPQPAP